MRSFVCNLSPSSELSITVAVLRASCPGPNSYYTIVFAIVLAALVCLCCGTCALRCVARRMGWDRAGYLRPLLGDPDRDLDEIFRDSWTMDGEEEWMCHICGFDNKPKAKECTLCGTKHRPQRDGREASYSWDARRLSISSDRSERKSLLLSERQEAFHYKRLNQL